MWFKQRANVWLTKRIPSSTSHTLSSRNIFILPTPFGVGYLCFVLLLFLLGTNYQNNIIILFSYLLASFFITVMMHSFFNFSKMTFTVSNQHQTQTGYAEQTVYFPINIKGDKNHYDINLSLKELPDKLICDEKQKHLGYVEQGSNNTQLAVKCQKRGEFSLGRVTAHSEYSFGLFKSWSQLAFDQNVIVYPKPKRLINKYHQLSNDKEEQGENYQQHQQQRGTDDFSELKAFVRGESKARTAWKQLAKGQGHFTKHYQENKGGLQWLKLADMPAADIETQLGYLTFLVNELTRTEQCFGLNLSDGHIDIAPDSGLRHQSLCLQALARF